MKNIFKTLAITFLLITNLFVLSCSNSDAINQNQEKNNVPQASNKAATNPQTGSIPNGTPTQLVFQNNNTTTSFDVQVIFAKGTPTPVSPYVANAYIDSKEMPGFTVHPGETVTFNNFGTSFSSIPANNPNVFLAKWRTPSSNLTMWYDTLANYGLHDPSPLAAPGSKYSDWTGAYIYAAVPGATSSKIYLTPTTLVPIVNPLAVYNLTNLGRYLINSNYNSRIDYTNAVGGTVAHATWTQFASGYKVTFFNN